MADQLLALCKKYEDSSADCNLDSQLNEVEILNARQNQMNLEVF